MPTDLGVASERKRKAQAQARTDTTILLVCLIFTLVVRHASLADLVLRRLLKNSKAVGEARVPTAIGIGLDGAEEATPGSSAC
jgi:hypothetical protein